MAVEAEVAVAHSASAPETAERSLQIVFFRMFLLFPVEISVRTPVEDRFPRDFERRNPYYMQIVVQFAPLSDIARRLRGNKKTDQKINQTDTSSMMYEALIF